MQWGPLLPKGGRNDPGGYWWLPAYSTWTPNTVSFSVSVSLIVAQNLLFLAVFRVLNFWNRFEALNDVFRENGETRNILN